MRFPLRRDCDVHTDTRLLFALRAASLFHRFVIEDVFFILGYQYHSGRDINTKIQVLLITICSTGLIFLQKQPQKESPLG